MVLQNKACILCIQCIYRASDVIETISHRILVVENN